MRLRTALALVVLALVMASGSVGYQRVGPIQVVEGEGFCPGREPCHVPALAGGFPLPYLVDDPQISVPHSLGVGEDDFHRGAFAVDALFFLGLGLVAYYLAGWAGARIRAGREGARRPTR